MHLVPPIISKCHVFLSFLFVILKQQASNSPSTSDRWLMLLSNRHGSHRFTHALISFYKSSISFAVTDFFFH